jgi:hypothetical protein
MSLGAYVGNISFVKQANSQWDDRYTAGYQTMLEPWRGPHSALDDFLEEWPKGKVHPDYPQMVLADRRWTKGIGYTDVDLVWFGFRSADDITESGTDAITLEDTVELQSASFTTDADDTVEFKFYAPTTTVGWLYFGDGAPASPRFVGTLASGISIQLFDPYPADYKGTAEYEFQLRTLSFRRTRIMPKIWACMETHSVRCEPDVDKPITTSS